MISTAINEQLNIYFGKYMLHRNHVQRRNRFRRDEIDFVKAKSISHKRNRVHRRNRVKVRFRHQQNRFRHQRNRFRHQQNRSRMYEIDFVCTKSIPAARNRIRYQRNRFRQHEIDSGSRKSIPAERNRVRRVR